MIYDILGSLHRRFLASVLLVGLGGVPRSRIHGVQGAKPKVRHEDLLRRISYAGSNVGSTLYTINDPDRDCVTYTESRVPKKSGTFEKSEMVYKVGASTNSCYWYFRDRVKKEGSNKQKDGGRFKIGKIRFQIRDIQILSKKYPFVCAQLVMKSQRSRCIILGAYEPQTFELIFDKERLEKKKAAIIKHETPALIKKKKKQILAENKGKPANNEEPDVSDMIAALNLGPYGTSGDLVEDVVKMCKSGLKNVRFIIEVLVLEKRLRKLERKKKDDVKQHSIRVLDLTKLKPRLRMSVDDIVGEDPLSFFGSDPVRMWMSRYVFADLVLPEIVEVFRSNFQRNANEFCGFCDTLHFSEKTAQFAKSVLEEAQGKLNQLCTEAAAEKAPDVHWGPEAGLNTGAGDGDSIPSYDENNPDRDYQVLAGSPKSADSSNSYRPPVLPGQGEPATPVP